MTGLEVMLPSGIVYVAGHVNGVVTVFHQDRLNYMRWKASVESAKDSLYHIELEMHDEAGNVGYFEDTIEYILPVFVYDRTQEDIDRVRELRQIGWNKLTDEQRAEWLGGLKGCLNTADLKRIENNIYVIAQLLKLKLQTNKDNLPDIPNGLYFQQMIDNVSAIRATGYVYKDTPVAPVQPLNTFQKINDIEHILHDVYKIYNENNSSFVYCGKEIYAGDCGIL